MEYKGWAMRRLTIPASADNVLDACCVALMRVEKKLDHSSCCESA